MPPCSCSKWRRRELTQAYCGLALLSHASLPISYWSYAFETANFLINILSSRKLQHVSPLECLFHLKPDYKFLKTFGCACYLCLRSFNSHKLHPTSFKCIFLGYSHMHKGHRCFNPLSNKIIISRDLRFDGSVFPYAILLQPSDSTFATLSSMTVAPPTAPIILQFQIQLIPPTQI